MKLTVIGCSDAFGSGARLQTCFHVANLDTHFLIDCGATSLIGLAREGLDPNQVSVIFISHLHGDHFSGLIWWLIHAHHVAKRTSPLTIVGPAGIEQRLKTASEALFPGTTDKDYNFDLQFFTYNEPVPLTVGSITAIPFVVSHPSGATSYALRLETDGKIISYSGDTEWVETLVPAAKGADLFICECFGFDQNAGYHMNWTTISQNLPRLTAKQIMLTHMSNEMLAKTGMISAPRVLFAEDGLKIEL